MTRLRKILYLLPPAFTRWAWVLLFLLLVGTVLETLGLGLIIPTLAVITRPDIAQEYPWAEPYLSLLGDPTQGQLTSWALGLLVTFYVAKGLFLLFLAWNQARFAYTLSEVLGTGLLAGYLSQPYRFHLQRNSATLVRNITGEVSQFTGAALNLLRLQTELSAMIGIAALLVVVEPLGALVAMLLLGSMAYVFHWFSRGLLEQWGGERQHHDELRHQHLFQSLGGVKEIAVLGRTGYFVGRFAEHNKASFGISVRFQTIQQLPRLWLEVVGVASLAGAVFIMLGRGRDLESFIPTLAVFVAATFRLIPSLNRIVGSVQSLKYSLPVIDLLYDEYKILDSEQPHARTAEIALHSDIRLDDVSFAYPLAETRAIEHLSIRIPAGTSVGLVGESGAGKSTLVDIILGLFTPTEGRVLIDGADVQTALRGWQDMIGYVPQSIYLTDDSLRNNVAFGVPRDEIDEEAVTAAIGAAQLEWFVRSLPEGLDSIVGEHGVRLSGGQRQRIGVARALYHKPAVLVLDEATSALDSMTEDGVMEAVNALRGSRTLIIVAHRSSTVSECDQIYQLERGRLVNQGTHSELFPDQPTSSGARRPR